MQALERIQERLQHGIVVENGVNAECAEAIFQDLEDKGLIVRPDKVEELAEEKAQARLEALKFGGGSLFGNEVASRKWGIYLALVGSISLALASIGLFVETKHPSPPAPVGEPTPGGEAAVG